MHVHPPGRRRRALAAAAAVTTAAGLAACAPADADGVVELDFFQFKGEAVGAFDEIIAEFEAQNPDIDVVQNAAPDADTAIRTLLVKDKTPDVITLNGARPYGQLAEAGVFHDFSGDPLLERINPAVQEVLADLGTYEDEVSSLGYVSNADGIIYNREIFAEHGLEPPTTWDELIEICETLDAAGVTPFYGTLADAWTTLPAFNGIGAYAAQDGFFETLREQGADGGADAGVSFEQDFAEPLERLHQLYSYAQDGYRGRTYDDGNAAFAAGESAMLLQGVWALAPIKENNPDIDAGVFPYPTDDPDERLLVSGVDVTVTIGRDTPHPEEARRFVEFLFSQPVIDRFAASQNMFPSVVDSEGTEDPTLLELQPWFDEGRITGFIDHQIPASVGLDATLQQAMFDGDLTGALRTLDNEWRKVAARTSE
jgi:raffinose/stachyose/melibiose transport system substrate-binding protein